MTLENQMIRTLAGYAVVGVVGIIVFRLLFGLIGFAFSLLWTLLWLAALGFVFYLVLKLINPDAARRMRDKVSRKKKSES
jgi:membrane protein implicated in regulation of membrane protease activity